MCVEHAVVNRRVCNADNAHTQKYVATKLVLESGGGGGGGGCGLRRSKSREKGREGGV